MWKADARESCVCRNRFGVGGVEKASCRKSYIVRIKDSLRIAFDKGL